MTSSVRPLAFVVALVATAIPATVFAQQASPAAPPAAAAAPAAGECGGGGGGMNPMAGIQLTPAQREQIKSYRQAFRAQYPCGTKPTKAAREQLQQQIMSVLTPQQQAQYQANLAAHAQH